MIFLKPTVLVTGASGGIGLATARLFAAKGHPTVINYNRSRESAFEAAREINAAGGMAIAVRADVSQPEEVAADYRHQMTEMFSTLRQRAMQYRIDYVPVDIAEGFHQILLPFLLKRSKV